MQQCPDQGCWHPPCVPQLQEAAPRLLADFLTDGQRPVDLLELFFFFFLQSSHLSPAQGLLKPPCCEADCCFQRGAGVPAPAWPGRVRRRWRGVSPLETGLWVQVQSCRPGVQSFLQESCLHLTLRCCSPSRKPGIGVQGFGDLRSQRMLLPPPAHW